jgi:hypothetical protein
VAVVAVVGGAVVVVATSPSPHAAATRVSAVATSTVLRQFTSACLSRPPLDAAHSRAPFGLNVLL